MHIDTQGLLQPAIYLRSEHSDDRPEPREISAIIVHGISLPPGEFGQNCIQDFFCGKLNFSAHPYFATIAHLRVSSHLLIDRTGQVTQFVPFTKRAWHAGESCLAGQVSCNDFSIGIELEGTDEHAYEAIQYTRLAEVIQALQKEYPAITKERVVGHSDVAPGRKTDPGESFDWGRLQMLLI
ncbi:MAG TPA: 1,6-anhydro-N-acetylmuramyl-L-alanine amidase AmpD [Gammaproteobacteria bacterium]|nr:1,6-anhydro-N-acetylmuramyl-L-alanine amidase AmpD [Gammaproteobacteria bacterium]